MKPTIIHDYLQPTINRQIIYEPPERLYALTPKLDTKKVLDKVNDYKDSSDFLSSQD